MNVTLKIPIVLYTDNAPTKMGACGASCLEINVQANNASAAQKALRTVIERLVNEELQTGRL